MDKIPYFLLCCITLISCGEIKQQNIDRYAVVNRHDIFFTTIDSLNSLTVGNGDFAFTVDITGMQSFPEYYLRGIPLGTLSNWGWHSYPNTRGYHHDQVIKKFYQNGREVDYYHDFGGERNSVRANATRWLRQNPHRMNLGMIGLKLYDENQQEINIDGIKSPRQELDLWKGEITSYFEVSGIPVKVITVCHPDEDVVAVRITSELIELGRLAVELRFPEADPGWKNTALWGDNSKHISQIVDDGENHSLIDHQQDTTHYIVNLSYSSGKVHAGEDHRYILVPQKNHEQVSVCCSFENQSGKNYSNWEFESIRLLSQSYWETFWETGGAIDFSDCLDKRAFELERRVVLSRYLAQIQCSGTLPPQETGLTYNSWFGKFHLEMHWWHSVHFALWNKGNILEKQMQFYNSIRSQAKNLAAKQGYKGVRWPKMVGPEGLTSPSSVGNYLIWQQPHYIYFAELLYQTSGDSLSALKEYGNLVSETADFMASFPLFDSSKNRYVLAPPLIPAQETFEVDITMNPSFELTYWKWALNTAIEWKGRLNQPVPGDWKEVVDRLSQLPIQDSLYLFTENGTDSYSNIRYLSDHPMILGCVGLLPRSDFIDQEIMQNTFDNVVAKWNWPHTWGWDFPMVAMAAGALGRYEDAVDYLLMDIQTNTYLPNGHNYQDERLTLYMPGNGGLLTAVAKFCTKNKFPDNGEWNVKWENLNDF